MRAIGFPRYLLQRVGLAGTEVFIPHIGVQQLCHVFGFAEISGHGSGDHLEPEAGAGKRHVKDIDVVDGLKYALPAVIGFEKGIDGTAVQSHAVDSFGLVLQFAPFQSRAAPRGTALEQGHLFGKRHYHEGEFQAF